MAKITIDLSQFPVVVLTYPSQISDDDLRSHFTEMGKAVGDKTEPYAVVVDLTHGKMLNAQQRQMQAEYLQSRHDRISKICLGMSFAVSSPLIRSGLTAIFWLSKQGYPRKVCKTRKEAIDWAKNLISSSQQASTSSQGS